MISTKIEVSSRRRFFSKKSFIRWCMAWCCITAAAFSAACQQQPRSSPKSGVLANPDTRTPATKLSAYLYQYPPTPPVLNDKDLKKFVEQFRHRVVVLDFWASWSPRSREGLGVLADLQADMQSSLGDQQFQVISCNFDSPENWSVRTVPMLQAAGANYPCVLIPKEFRGKIRDWLAPEWSYDLPARFLLDRGGNVVSRTFSATSVEPFVEESRRLAMGSGAVAGRLASRDASVSTVSSVRQVDQYPRVSIRAKLVNIATGEAESLTQAAAAVSPEALAEAMASSIGAKLDRSKNQRIGLLPFASAKQRGTAGTFGMETARRLEQALRKHGFFDLVSPLRTEQMLESAGVTAMAIDYDPAVVQQRLGVDYLVVGWIRGDVDGDAPRTVVATDDSETAPE